MEGLREQTAHLLEMLQLLVPKLRPLTIATDVPAGRYVPLAS